MPLFNRSFQILGKGYEQIKDSLPKGIEVACHNSKDNCTLTGPAELVGEFVEQLQEQKVFAKTVNVANIAYHSKHIAPAGPGLLKRLKEVGSCSLNMRIPKKKYTPIKLKITSTIR